MNMKKIICCMMAALMMICAACAETISPESAAPTATALPMGETFSSEDLIVTLPWGLTILTGEAFSGYEAALQADFPDSGKILLAAVNEISTQALSFIRLDLSDPAKKAADEAARIILGDSAVVSEVKYGENLYSSFSCGIGDDVYHLYFLSGEEALLIVGASGIENAEIETMLSGLIF